MLRNSCLMFYTDVFKPEYLPLLHKNLSSCSWCGLLDYAQNMSCMGVSKSFLLMPDPFSSDYISHGAYKGNSMLFRPTNPGAQILGFLTRCVMRQKCRVIIEVTYSLIPYSPPVRQVLSGGRGSLGIPNIQEP